MKKNILLSFLFILVGSTVNSQSLPKKLSFEDLKPIIQSHSVIIFGENHSNISDNQYYPLMIEEITQIDSHYNCIALELSSTLQNEFDQIKNEKDYSSFFLKYINGIQFYKELYLSKSDLEKMAFLNSFVKYNSAWLTAALIIKNKGGKAVLVDDLTGLSQNVVSTMVYRNKAMSKAVASLIDNKQCSKVIMINGAEHISTWHGENLLDLLSNYNSIGFLTTDVYLPDPRTIKLNISERLN